MKGNNNHDLQLINEIADNNCVSYNKLFSSYYNSLCHYVYNIIRDKNDTEDIVQELFLNLWKNRNKLDIQSSVSFYLYKTARNLTLNYIRDNQKYKNSVDYTELQNQYVDEQTIEQHEFRQALNDCIDKLPGRNKEILLLHKVKGFKQKEISDKLNISVKTIKNQIWIAMQRLKNCLSLKEIEFF